MRRTIELKNGAVTLESNAATPLIAKRIFKIDYFSFLDGDETVGDKTTAVMKLAFVMAKQAEVAAKFSGTSERLNALFQLKDDDFLAWSSEFEFDEMLNTIVPTAIEVWTGSNATNSEPKNQQGQQ